jgi:putative ABC transport system permease protein
MFTNHFKFAFRKLIRNSSFSLINIFGLAIGVAASLLIYRVIGNETSYDTYHTKKNQIYRVVSTTSNQSNGEITGNSGSVPLPLPYAVRLDFPQFEKVAAIVNAGTPQVYVLGKGISDEKQFKENTGAFYAEPSLFDIFDYTWLSGNANRLKEPNTVVLSKSIAEKYFGDWKQAVGKTIELWSWRSKFMVTGVFKDPPANTDIPVDMAMSYISLHPSNPADINNRNAWQYTDNVFKTECFLLLSKKQNINRLTKQLPYFVKKYYQESNRDRTHTTLAFQPLSDMHLDERFDTYPGDVLPLKELWSLGVVGLFLLLIACINFINLATAQSVNRAKEIGVRKVLGGNRRSLINQLLSEAALITSLAILLGYILALFVQPYVEQLIQKPLSLNLIDNPLILLFLIVAGLLVTFLAGFYPAFVLSGFQPAEAFRNVKTQSIFGISVRRSLVVTQFVIAQLLIIGTLVVFKQMDYFRNRPMGFEKKAIAIIDLPGDRADKQKYDYLKHEMLQIPGVIAASYCMDPPSSDEKIYSPIYYNNNPKKLGTDYEIQFADTSYLNTFSIRLVTGRLPNPSDTIRELLVNETAVKNLGLQSPEQIIGKKMSYNSHKQFPVVGVIHDFTSRSLRDPILPLVLSTNKNMYTDIALRIDPEKLVNAMGQVQRVFKRVIPTYVYDPVYFDDSIWQYYKKEAITSQLFKISAVLAIILSCLGLYGLVSFVVVQKTKEVGIRKVLGASVPSILYLFSKEFITLITIAFLIAAPVGYYFMHRWLNGFYNHADLGWGIFIIAVSISLTIAGITVGYTTFRAAIANPVNSLRSE